MPVIELLLALALAAGDAPAEAAKPDYVVKPVWAARPDGTDFARFLPEGEGAAAGRTVVECTVGAAGLLENCRTIQANPAGPAFDTATVALVSSEFVLGPKDRADRDVAGRPIRIPVDWNLVETNPGGDDHGPLSPPATKAKDRPMFEGCMPSSTKASAGGFTPSLTSCAYGWAEQPTAREISWARPLSLIRSSVSGGAAIFCTLKADGGLTDCRVATETPAGRGFGGAAIKLSAKYRMNLPADGRSLEGETVLLDFDWIAKPGRAASMPREIMRTPVQPPNVR